MSRCSGGFATIAMLASCLYVLEPAAAQTAQSCGTALRPEDVPIVLERQMDGVYDPPVERGGGYNVAITFHIVRRSDGTGGIELSRIVAALDDANQHFANAGIRFCWVGPIDYIDDDTYYHVDSWQEMDDLRNINVVAGTVNIYFVKVLRTEDGCDPPRATGAATPRSLGGPCRAS